MKRITITKTTGKIKAHGLWIIPVILFLFLSAAEFKHETNKSSATVEQREGIYIFILSKPVAETEYLGSIEKNGIVMSGKLDEMLGIMIKKCKKEYPKADGLIFSGVDMSKADCIKFK